LKKLKGGNDRRLKIEEVEGGMWKAKGIDDRR
jgi:hypothetical protein